jgi:anti-sigma factor RsiW
MNHEELRMLLSSYLDGEVNDIDKTKVISHIETCDECQQFIEHTKQIREAVQAIGGIELPFDFAARTSRLTERRNEQAEEWLGVEPLARNTFFAIAVSVLMIFLLTNINKDVSASITEVLINGSDGDSIATQVLLQPGTLSKNDLLYAVMTK